MKFILKLLFNKYIEGYSKIAVQYVEDSCLELKGSEKKEKAIEFIVKRLRIPLFFKKLPIINAFLCRHLNQIQVLIANILSDEIDYFIDTRVKELKNKSA